MQKEYAHISPTKNHPVGDYVNSRAATSAKMLNSLESLSRDAAAIGARRRTLADIDNPIARRAAEVGIDQDAGEIRRIASTVAKMARSMDADKKELDKNMDAIEKALNNESEA